MSKAIECKISFSETQVIISFNETIIKIDCSNDIVLTPLVANMTKFLDEEKSIEIVEEPQQFTSKEEIIYRTITEIINKYNHVINNEEHIVVDSSESK